jgi:hypothetical protein
MSLTARVRKLEGRCPTRPFAHFTDQELETRIEQLLEGVLRKVGIGEDPTLWQAWAEDVLSTQMPPDTTEILRRELDRLRAKYPGIPIEGTNGQA